MSAHAPRLTPIGQLAWHAVAVGALAACRDGWPALVVGLLDRPRRYQILRGRDAATVGPGAERMRTVTVHADGRIYADGRDDDWDVVAVSPPIGGADKAGRVRHTRAILAAFFPLAFPADPVPLARNIRGRIRETLADGDGRPALSTRQVFLALSAHCRQPAYLRGLVDGAPRFDLAGRPHGTVEPHEAEDGARRLAEATPVRLRRSAAAAATAPAVADGAAAMLAPADRPAISFADAASGLTGTILLDDHGSPAGDYARRMEATLAAMEADVAALADGDYVRRFQPTAATAEATAPTLRASLMDPRDVLAAMAADIAALIRATGADGTVTDADLARLGWTPAQIALHRNAALSLAADEGTARTLAEEVA